MICNNCGAHFDDDLPKCPYCGDFHYAGAQKEYMDKLENMKENLDTLEKSVPQMYTDELKTQVKHVRKIVLIIISILAVLMLLFFMCFHLDSFSSRDEKQVLLFTKEAYPVADEYYEAGDYEGLLTFYHTSMSENKNADFYFSEMQRRNWTRITFLTTICRSCSTATSPIIIIRKDILWKKTTRNWSLPLKKKWKRSLTAFL